MFNMADGFRRLRASSALHNAVHRPASGGGTLFGSMVQQSHALSQTMHSNALTSMDQTSRGPGPTGFGGMGIGF
jgi:hypothetical protein